MRKTPWTTLSTALLAALLLAACSPGGEGDDSAAAAADEAPATADAPAQEAASPAAAEPEAVEPEAVEPEGEAASPLADTSWRLVNIASMDDTNYAPEDRDLYTLSFHADGSMNLRADCNQGRGTWSNESGSQLRFGPVAATMAMCPPGSLHDRYLQQFEWVRSYVMEDGHLFLATMADGSIIEFEPMPAE